MTRNAREAAPDDWIEYEELSRLAGWNPEPRELKELRRAGVLQPGYQEHPPGVRGSVGFYPRDAGAQLRRIAELRNRYRRFDELLLALWWEGRWVDRGNLRDALAALMDDAGLREVRDLTDRYPDVYDRADVVLAEVHKRARRSPILRHLRSQILGHRLVDLDTVVYALALLAFGEEPAWESRGDPPREMVEQHPNDLVRAATGYDRAGRDTYRLEQQRLGPLLPPAQRMMDKFQPLIDAGVLPVTNMPCLLAQASDAELDQARDDTRLVAEPFMQLARIMEAVFGHGAFGLGLSSHITPTPPNRACLTVMMIGLRKTWTAEQLANRNKLASQFAKTAPTLRMLETHIGTAR